jgi:mRNA deadenylase 3'-5' endonuclease subunit Ccr4
MKKWLCVIILFFYFPVLYCAGTIDSNLIFKVVSYNILSDNYLHYGGYDKLPPNVIEWQFRKDRLLNQIISLNADIICLQEINQQGFEFFLHHLRQIGYEGVFGLNPTHQGDSVATFFDTKKLKYNGHAIHPYPGTGKVFLEVKFGGDAPLTVVNTKFKWDQVEKNLDSHAGYQQSKHLLNVLQNTTNLNNVVLCGDLNMTAQQPHFKLIKDAFKDAFQNQEVYTYQQGGQLKRIDYILHSADIISKPIITEQKQLLSIPSVNWPSDHLIVMATLKREAG